MHVVVVAGRGLTELVGVASMVLTIAWVLIGAF